MKSRLLRALLIDYGMVFVLLFLCALISLLTIADIHPEDPRAGRRLAQLMVKKYGKEINVLVVARNIDADKEVCQRPRTGANRSRGDRCRNGTW